MRRVFTTSDYYLPAYKAGGSVVSLSRILSRLGGEVEFSVFTQAHDLGDASLFRNLPRNEWTPRPEARVYYASPDRLNPAGLLAAIREADPQVIYMNSYFSVMTRAVLALRRRGLLPGIALTIGPRGELGHGALRRKRLRKSVYLRVAPLLGFHRDVVWHASTEHEAADIRREIGDDAAIVVVRDLLGIVHRDSPHAPIPKHPGSARFVFLSRISPIKNLLGAIELLSDLQGEATFTVYGPEEDRAYWLRCQAAIDALPPNVRVELKGAISPDEVPNRLAQAHFFLYPTLGENFGHAIVEALSAGLPVLLSDQTPWDDLEAHGAGWVMPLTDAARWRERVQSCVDLDGETYRAMSRAAVEYAEVQANDPEESDRNRLLFRLDARPETVPSLPTKPSRRGNP